MENEYVLSPLEINNFQWASNILAILSLIFGLFSIYVVWRFSRSNMCSYKLHLTNISISILLCDLCFQFFCRPHTIVPIVGGCMFGVLNPVLARNFGLDMSFWVTMSIQMFFITSSMASIANATIHRYLSICKLFHPTATYLNDKVLFLLMFFLQIGWPFIGSCLIFKIELHPEESVHFNFERYPKLYSRVSNFPCIIATSNLTQIQNQLRFAAPLFLHMNFVVFISCLFLFLSWLKIYKAQWKKFNLSRTTLDMEKKLITSLFLQTIIPDLFFLVASIVLILSILGVWQSNSQQIATLSMSIGSMHSVLNCITMCLTIKEYKKQVGFMIKNLFSKNRPQFVTPTTTL